MEAIKSDSTLVKDYSEFVKEYDQIHQNQFEGRTLELLTKKFISKHKEEIEKIPFFVETNFPNQQVNETLQEDWMIISRDKYSDEEEPSKANRLVADIYRRAATAVYFRATFNKSRLNQEDDRSEAVDLCRYSLRHTPDDFDVNYFYMVAIGWQLKNIDSLKERMKIVKIFRDVTRRCIKMNPHNAVAHHILGRYYFEVGQLGWIQKKVAEGFMGSSLDGTLADAEREFLIAHELKGDWMPTGLFMAQTLHAQKRPYSEIKKWIDFGLNLKCEEPTSELERQQLIEFDANLK